MTWNWELPFTSKSESKKEIYHSAEASNPWTSTTLTVTCILQFTQLPQPKISRKSARCSVFQIISEDVIQHLEELSIETITCSYGSSSALSRVQPGRICLNNPPIRIAHDTAMLGFELSFLRMWKRHYEGDKIRSH